jgi:2-(1,2-epoxy-1,2-dihydrophenyl)acetyl-CoA isomerase
VTTQRPPVHLDVEDGTARVTLDRPDAANAIDRELAQALADVVATLGRDPSLRAVLLRGRGERFCGGGDVKSLAEAGPDLAERLDAIVTPFHAAVEGLAALDAPVVAAVQGSAAGAGLALALGADLVVAAASARFVVAYSGIGLTPDGGTTWYLERSVGRQRALELLLTNRVLDANEALAWGIVNRVVADDDLTEAAESLVTQLACGPTRAFGGAKRLVDAARRADLVDHLADEAETLVKAGRTTDGQAGVLAFTEKRRATFVGE